MEQSAIEHLEQAEAEIAAAIRLLGVGTRWDRALSFVAVLLIAVRGALREAEEARVKRQ